MTARNRSQRGVTLMEVLIAVSLLSFLAVGILTAMRVGLGALDKANNRLLDNRKVAGTQSIIEQQFGGLIPVQAPCIGGESPGPAGPFFEGESQSMRFVSTYSLAGAWRDVPRIIEYRVIPAERGVRLVVNELPYWGPASAGMLCTGMAPDPLLGTPARRFRPVEVGPASFVLADHLAYCRFVYLLRRPPPLPDTWLGAWASIQLPGAVRIDMAPLEEDASRLRPAPITAQIRIRRAADIDYGDYAQ